MKVTVTELWAPWPDGTQRGHVVELQGDTIPPWAVGKCEPAPADAEVTMQDAAPQPAGDQEDAQRAAALAAADAQHAEEVAASEARAGKSSKAKHKST